MKKNVKKFLTENKFESVFNVGSGLTIVHAKCNYNVAQTRAWAIKLQPILNLSETKSILAH